MRVEKEKSHSITKEELWALQKVLRSRKGTLSATYKKSTEANTKVYDLNQKTMQALGSLAGVYATFEEAWANLENDNSEGDPLYADACVFYGRACKGSATPGPLPRRSEGLPPKPRQCLHGTQ